MYKMTILPRILQSHSALGILCLALSLTQGCARSEPSNPAGANSQASEQKLPFHSDADQSSSSSDANPAIPADPTLATGLPFRDASHPRILPSGTLVTVQLEDSLSAAKVRPGDTFAASVAAPLAIDGDTLVEPGTPVIGRIESAQSPIGRPGLVPGSGYFRLTLNAITVEGRQFALQTSSLFARGTAQPSSPSDSRSAGLQVHKGRRLTFRLTAPVTLNEPSSMATRQSSGPIPE
jgi:hypothetical protein